MLHRGRLLDAGITFVLFAANLLVAWPFLTLDLSNEAWNNDYTYVAIARMFREQPWTWNSLQYCGAPFAYAYPPLMHVLIAAMPVSVGHAFHLLSAVAYGLVPLSLYALALCLFGSRPAALFAAAGYSFLASPVYALFSAWRNLAAPHHYAPWNFIALMSYSEAGHTVALAISFAAIAAAWKERWRTAVCCTAAVFLTNWPGLIGLCTAYAALAVAKGRKSGYGRAAVQAFAAIGAAYGLAAFWMTPGFFYTTTLLNRVALRHEAAGAPWGARTSAIVICGAVLLAVALWRRIPPAASFVAAWLAVAGTIVAAYSVAGNYLVPLPHRYVAECNAALILAVAGCAAIGNKRWRIAVMTVAFVSGAWAARGFLRNPWNLEPAKAEPQTMLAFQVSDWLEHNAAGSRVFAAGELDGALNALSGIAQVGGTTQGVSNYLVYAAQRQISRGCWTPSSARLAELWLRALNARFAVVHDGTSREYFHLFVAPQAFAVLPVAWTNGNGDTIYRLPPPEEYPAVVVDLASLERIPPLRSTGDLDFLESYVAWAHGKRPARISWTRPDTAQIEADFAPGEAVLVKTNYDRGWSSTSGSIQPDPIGFVLIRPPPGPHHLVLRFGASWEVWLARTITLLTIVLLAVRAPLVRIAAIAVIPALAVYGALLMTAPHRAAIAEEAFRTIQPPLINPGGLVEVAGPAGSRFLTIYGSNFGSPQDRVAVWAGDARANIVYHTSNQLNVEIPSATPANSPVGVEVNGCHGNSFLLPSK